MSNERHEISFPDPATGRLVHAERIAPGSAERGTVLLLHGLGDNISRHEWIKEILLARGYGILGIDWPGCGKSEGVRGDLPLIADAHLLVEEAIAQADVEIRAAFTHSTGGFFLSRILTHGSEPLSGLRWVWFSSSLTRPDAMQSAFRIALAKRVSRWFPTLTVSTHVRRDDCYHTAPDEDPKHHPEGVHSRVSLRFAGELLAQAIAHPEIGSGLPPETSYLVTHGLEDDVCPPLFAEHFFQAIRSEDSTLLLAAGARHEPFREPDRDRFLQATGLWLDRVD